MKTFRQFAVFALFASCVLSLAVHGQLPSTPGSAKPISDSLSLFKAPLTLSAPGKPGWLAYDSTYFYVYDITTRAWIQIGGGGGGGAVSNVAYNASTWSGVTTVGASKNAIRDKFELMAPLASPSFTGAAAIATTIAGNTIGNGWTLSNPTAATNSTSSNSPFIEQDGFGWKTAATPASQSVGFRFGVLPSTGLSNPLGSWQLQKSINGGAWVTVLTLGIGAGDVQAGGSLIAAPGSNVLGDTVKSLANSFWLSGNGSGGGLTIKQKVSDTDISNLFFSANGADKNITFTADASIGGTNTGDQTPSSLGLVIGTNVQAFSTNLTTFAAIAPSANIQTFLAAANYAAAKALFGFVASDVGLGSVTNAAQTLASVVPNTLPSSGQVPIGNAGGTAYVPVTLSGKVTVTSAGVTSVTLASGDIPANAANTSGTAANLSGTPALPNGTTATTQTLADNSTKLATTAFVIANAGSGTAANPSATIGLTANNGVATTYMRSDATPALGLGIAPHWTGQHWFDLNPRITRNTAPTTGTSALALGTDYTITPFTSNYSFTGVTGTSGASRVHLNAGNGTSSFTWTTAAQRNGDPVGTSTTFTPSAGDHNYIFWYDTVVGALFYADDNIGINAVANGGTGLSSGTSGGVLAFTASGTIASSGVLAANAIVVGGGAGVAPSTVTTGTGVLTALGVATNAAGGFSPIDGTATLTNKRVTVRTNTTASSATPAINTDTTDEFTITALAAAITSMTTSLTGTPVNGDQLLIRIKDNGTARAITWGASFEACGAVLPTTTVVSKRLYALFIYDSTAAKWGCVSVANEL